MVALGNWCCHRRRVCRSHSCYSRWLCSCGRCCCGGRQWYCCRNNRINRSRRRIYRLGNCLWNCRCVSSFHIKHASGFCRQGSIFTRTFNSSTPYLAQSIYKYYSLCEIAALMNSAVTCQAVDADNVILRKEVVCLRQLL